MSAAYETRRQEAVTAVLEGGRLPSEVARDHGIASKTLLKWIRESYQSRSSRQSRIMQEIETLEIRLSSLKREIDKLQAFSM
ncbi:transposase [Shewanella litorisediminis]|uniref:Transposase n=1 Tax=Shewanella litorisediminis TaxID=1173586 RepID=A0ABX7G1Y2_9GAMM|nr:transposase [Shewanella litorisediminis]MCL2918489.1 transposase [Shewanella litorisediminis]QRH01321.1 transposase [Shewanella litorisediminis]